jgi:hypothetical protein
MKLRVMNYHDGLKRIRKAFCKSGFEVIGFCIILIFFQFTSLFAYSGRVAIVFEQSNNTYLFAAEELKKAIESAGYTVTLENVENLSGNIADYRIILTCRGTQEVNRYLNQPGVSPLPPSIREGYSTRKIVNGKRTDWYIIGFDKTGTMYGGLDLAQSVQGIGFAGLKNADKKPYLLSRGIKFNIPLDARTPTYSDNGDQAQKNIANMWDINFWHEFLDEMARDRLNMVSLWNSAPFPSMVYVPEYPEVRLDDVKKTTVPLCDFGILSGQNMSNSNTLANLVTLKKITIADKVRFWQEVMQYGSDRGVDFYLFTWNIYVYGTENSGYNFTTALTDTKTMDYFRKATKTLIKTYPLLKGIGLTAGENMGSSKDIDAKESFLFRSYGLGINDALQEDTTREFRLIHRGLQSVIPTIKSAFTDLNPRCSLEFSYKYSLAHIYSSVAPDYMHSFEGGGFLEGVGSSNYFFTVRDDDWYMLRGGSDPAFARAYIKKMPYPENFQGFYLGPDGYTWGREYISNEPDSPTQLILKKRWYSFQLWGKLGYDPDIPDSDFVKILASRFKEVDVNKLYDAWAMGSQVVPLVNRFHNMPNFMLDYLWYPEACYSCRNGWLASGEGFNNINSFINSKPQSGEGIMSIIEYADAVLNSNMMAGTTPLQIAQSLMDRGNQVLSLTSAMTNIKDKELRLTINDIKAMAFLGQYYSKKISGSTNKCLSDRSSDPVKKEQYKKAAIKDLLDASDFWRKYASQIAGSYVPSFFTRMEKVMDLKVIQAEVDNDILLAGGSLPTNSPLILSGGKITYDISSTSKGINKDNIKWVHTVGTGTNRMLVAGIAIEDNVAGNTEIVKVTYNGLPMKPVVNSELLIGTGNYSKSALYYLPDPDSGAHEISVTTAGSCNGIIGGAISLFGAYAGAPETARSNSLINSSIITSGITTLTNDSWVVDVINTAGDSISLSPEASMKNRWNNQSVALSAAASAQPVDMAGMIKLVWQTPSDKMNNIVHSIAVFKPGPGNNQAKK